MKRMRSTNRHLSLLLVGALLLCILWSLAVPSSSVVSALGKKRPASSLLLGNEKALAFDREELAERLGTPVTVLAEEGLSLYDAEALLQRLLPEANLQTVVLLLDPSDGALTSASADETALTDWASRVQQGNSSPVPAAWADADHAALSLSSSDWGSLPQAHSRALAHPFEASACLLRIRRLCETHGVRLLPILPALSAPETAQYDEGELSALLKAFAGVSGYWCFLNAADVNTDARYYYDVTHFRSAAAHMMLSRIFCDDDAYVPADFGFYVLPETIETDAPAAAIPCEPADEAAYTCSLPVLMYHAIAYEAGTDSDMTVSLARFSEQMQALHDNGYTAVAPEDVYAYVTGRSTLPEKPVWITFDDGYTSNLTLAAPVLEACGLQATVFCVGTSMGADTYKTTGIPITPHFSFNDALPWVSQNVISLGSHTFDMHQTPALDGAGCRVGTDPLPTESPAEYQLALATDFSKSQRLFTNALGSPALAFAYPHGHYSAIVDAALHDAGFAITCTTELGDNRLIKGLPQSLYLLRRNSIYEITSAYDLLFLLEHLDTIQ